METREARIRALLITGAAAVILQLVLAPSIAIASVVPNFIMVAVGIMALYTSATRSAISGFILGFCYDLFSQGPVGVMALILTVIGYALSTAKKDSFEGNIIVELLAFGIVMLLGEIVHGVVLAIIGYDLNVLYSLIFRSLPGALYEIVIGIVAFIVLNYIINKRAQNKKGRLKNPIDFRAQGRSLGKGRPLNRKLR